MIIRQASMSGHCAVPASDDPARSHRRCQDKGGYNRANPAKEFSPCPCSCHFDQTDLYECGNCGRPVAAHLGLPLDDEGDPIYYHLDASGRGIAQECA